MKWNAMEWNRLDKGSREGRKIKVGNSKIASLIKYSIPYHSGTIMCSSRKYPYPTKEGIYKQTPLPLETSIFLPYKLCKFVFSLTPFPQEFTIPSTEGMNIFWNYTIDHIRILTIGLELPRNKGPGGGIFSNANIFNDIPPHEPLLQASSSPIMRIQIWLIMYHVLYIIPYFTKR